MPPKNLTTNWKLSQACVKCGKKKNEEKVLDPNFIAKGGGGAIMIIDGGKRVKKIFLDQERNEEKIKAWMKKIEEMSGERPEHPQESFDREVRLHQIAEKKNIAPKLYNANLADRTYELDKLDETILQYCLRERKLDDDLQEQIIKRYKELDAIGLHHNDSNCRNVMLKDRQVYIIDFGRSTQFPWFKEGYKAPFSWSKEEIKNAFTNQKFKDQREYLLKVNESSIISNLEAINGVLTGVSGLAVAYNVKNRTQEKSEDRKMAKPQILVNALMEYHKTERVLRSACGELRGQSSNILTREDFNKIWESEEKKKQILNVSVEYYGNQFFKKE